MVSREMSKRVGIYSKGGWARKNSCQQLGQAEG